ncbi:beta-1 adrenergic receptor-like [Oculina patagonica]
MVAVKTKRRLQTHPNILLACLALADLMVGLVVQPVHITVLVSLLQGREFHEFCGILVAKVTGFFLFNIASLFHLVLISGERYLAMNYTFVHDSFVTKSRLMFASVLAWIGAALTLIMQGHVYARNASLFIIGTIISLIIYFQIIVYKHACRHEEQILSQQVSAEARAKFRKEMKALKLTTAILVALLVCYFPSFICRVLIFFAGDNISVEVKTVARSLIGITIILNSLFNPVIYVVRVRQFRVAFIELLLRKSFQDAEQFERRLFTFGSPNEVVRVDPAGPEEVEEGGEERGQNSGESRNPNHVFSNQEDNPEV